VGALVGLLAAALINFSGMFAAWTAYAPDLYAAAFGKADEVKLQSAAAMAAIGQVRERQAAAIAQQQWLAKVQNERFESLDMLRAVQSLLPHDEGDVVPENPADRNELHIGRMDCQFFPDLSVWFGELKQQWAETHISDDSAADTNEAQPPGSGAAATGDGQGAEAPAPPPDAAAVEGGEAAKTAEVTGPTGPGWVVELQGHHFHNEQRHKPSEGPQFLRDTLIKNLLGKASKVNVSAGPLAGQSVNVSELGIGFPVIVESSPVRTLRIPVANLSEGSGRSAGAFQQPGQQPGLQPGGELPESTEPQELSLKRYDFVVQFCWQPRPAGQAPPSPSPQPAAAE
jgi:hypothetical protein